MKSPGGDERGHNPNDTAGRTWCSQQIGNQGGDNPDKHHIDRADERGRAPKDAAVDLLDN